MSYTLTETIRNDPITFTSLDNKTNKPSRFNDKNYKNKLSDPKISNQQKQRRQNQRRQGFLKKYENYKNKLKNSNVDKISEKISKKSPISDNVEESKEFLNPENLNSEMKKSLENYTLSTMMISFVTLVGMLFL